MASRCLMLLTDFLDCAWRQLLSNSFTTSTLRLAVTSSEPQTKKACSHYRLLACGIVTVLELMPVKRWNTQWTHCASKLSSEIHFLCTPVFFVAKCSNLQQQQVNSLFYVWAYLEELWSSGKVSLTCMSSVRLCTRALNKELRLSFSYRSSLAYWKIHVEQKNVSVSWLTR